MEDIGYGLAQVIEALKEAWGKGLVSLVLFGSFASGKARVDSDIDLLVIKRGFPQSRMIRRMALYPILEALPEDLRGQLSLVLLTPEEARVTHPFYLDMTLHCRILYDRSDFFNGILRALRERLNELGATRELDETGAPYWILKPDARPGEEIVL